MHRILFIITIFITSLVHPSQLDTLSIKGDITVSPENVIGDFTYSIHNDSNSTKNEWVFFIHPSVNILSVSQNTEQVKIDVQQGLNYRIITVNLAKGLEPQKRENIYVRFSINPQNNNPRMTISPEYVFLDARQFWFPYPVQDDQADFEFTVKTLSNLNSVMGGRLISEAIIVDKKISTWKNELKTISPGLTLIVTKSPNVSKHNINVYSNNKNFQNIIHKEFSPYWKIFQDDYRFVPLSQIHIVPLDISIPTHTNHSIEGEFLGNIFLVNNSIVETLDQKESPYQNWNTPSEQLVEVLIHELHHGFFPGLVKHKPEDLIFMESLVQNLTWDMISAVSPEWSKKMEARTRFYLQNLAITKQTNFLWEFLWNTSLLHSAMHSADLDGKTLVDTLVEKYQFIGYSKHDVFDTISQHKHQFAGFTNYDSTIFDNHTLSNFSLFNSIIQAKKTNFVISVTNETFFKKKKVVTLPVDATFLSMSHNYPFTWSGNLSWAANNITNSIHIEIPQGEIWETNFVENVSLLQTDSPLDTFESYLSDNYISQNNIGRVIIYNLNADQLNSTSQQINILDLAQQKLNILKQNDHKLIWDSTTIVREDLWFVNAFVVVDKKRAKFVTIPIQVQKNKYTVYNILDQ